MILIKGYIMQRAWSVNNILNKKRKLLPFDGSFYDLIGNPELKGSWIIYGDSGHGKTSFTMQLLKYLSEYEQALYLSLEEGDGESFKLALEMYDMASVSKNFKIATDSLAELKERLRKPKSPKVIIIDSVQYFDVRFAQIKELTEENPDKVFVFISHVDVTGKKPEGMVARKIKYHSPVKIFIQGYVAFSLSRYKREATKPFVIWQEGAKNFHGLNLENPNYTLIK
jgi:predicted AAA+ superfamily ATPase